MAEFLQDCPTELSPGEIVVFWVTTDENQVQMKMFYNLGQKAVYL